AGEEHAVALVDVPREVLHGGPAGAGVGLGQVLQADHHAPVGRRGLGRLGGRAHRIPFGVVRTRSRLNSTSYRTATIITPMIPATTRLTPTGVPTRASPSKINSP